MYIPAIFHETDLSKLHDFIEQNSFALLVSQVQGESFASHLPFLLERETGAYGCLIGHMAKANPQWESLQNQKGLAIFAGPHAYISPTWYQAENVVPTWNYTAVHAYGPVEIIEDPQSLRPILERSIQVFEQNMPQPWTLEAPEVFVNRLLAQIVGFRMVIEKLEGKWKINQNQPPERRAHVIQALQERGDENALALAAMMQAKLDPGK